MTSKDLRILAVDDNGDNLAIIGAIAEDAFPGSRLFETGDGPDGIELAISEDPDVVLLDIVMPGMDGFEVCRVLKTDERTCDIPVIFVTALRIDRENRIRALDAGAEGFLAKPLDEIEFTAQVRAMVKIKAANRARREERARLERLVGERTADLLRSQSAMLNVLEDLKSENEARRRTEMELREANALLERTFGRSTGAHTETTLRRSLSEKELLMRELQHRVKNSLSSVLGLLDLGAEVLDDDRSLTVIQETRERIVTLIALYEQLHLSGQIDRIDLRSYLGSIADKLALAYLGPSGRVLLESSLASVEIDPRRAATLGLIVNELVTNAMKYAFPNAGAGKIRLELKRGEEGTSLLVSDDGIGLTSNVEPGSGMGLRLVRMLANELDASVTVEGDHGTAVRITLR